MVDNLLYDVIIKDIAGQWTLKVNFFYENVSKNEDFPK